MENKVTFTKDELFVLIGGTVIAWDNKVGINDEEFSSLEERLHKVLNNEQVKELDDDLEILDPELDKAIHEHETYLKVMNKLLDLYEGEQQ